MAIETKRIIKEHLIICEGRDAFEFLIAFLNSPTLQYDKRFSNDIQVFDFGGNEQLGTLRQFIEGMFDIQLPKED